MPLNPRIREWRGRRVWVVGGSTGIATGGSTGNNAAVSVATPSAVRSSGSGASGEEFAQASIVDRHHMADSASVRRFIVASGASPPNDTRDHEHSPAA